MFRASSDQAPWGEGEFVSVTSSGSRKVPPASTLGNLEGSEGESWEFTLLTHEIQQYPLPSAEASDAPGAPGANEEMPGFQGLSKLVTSIEARLSAPLVLDGNCLRIVNLIDRNDREQTARQRPATAETRMS